MVRRDVLYVVAILVILLIDIVSKTDAAVTSSFKGENPSKVRDTAIRNALLAISLGKLPDNDDQLVELIKENVRAMARNKAIEPTAAIEAAAREAQEAVSEITAAYTGAIFRTNTVDDAQRLFWRFQKTIEEIVDFARSGDYGIQFQSKLDQFIDPKIT